MLKIGAFWLETPNNIIFLATTSTIPICTPHSLLEWRESGDHRGMYGVQIRVFFLVPDFACNGALWTAFLIIDLRSENRKNFFRVYQNGLSDLSASLLYTEYTGFKF